jgi:hypothetical protein
MVNYTNSKVYKIWSTLGNNIYVGSTTKQYLSQRMDTHRTAYKSWKDGKSNFISSFELFDQYGLQNCSIELIEAKECNSKDELHQLEGKYIRELECVNKRIAGRNKKEHYEDNREQLLEITKQYYKDNKERISEYKKHYNLENKEQISERRKQTYEDTREQQIEQSRQYRENNKDKISKHRNQIYNCECGSNYTRLHKALHFKSMKHCQFIESQNNLIQ